MKAAACNRRQGAVPLPRATALQSDSHQQCDTMRETHVGMLRRRVWHVRRRSVRWRLRANSMNEEQSIVGPFSCNMDQVEPILNDFDGSVQEILAHQQLRRDQSLVKICKLLQNKFIKLNAVVADRFELFSTSTDQMWDGINAQRFGAFKKLVEPGFPNWLSQVGDDGNRMRFPRRLRQ